MDADPLDMLKEMQKGGLCSSMYSMTPKDTLRDDFSEEEGEDDEDPADMMRVLGNEEALFMTLSEGGFKTQSIIE